MKLTLSAAVRNRYLAEAEEVGKRYAQAEFDYFLLEVAAHREPDSTPLEQAAERAREIAIHLGEWLVRDLMILVDQGMKGWADTIIDEAINETEDARDRFKDRENWAGRTVPRIPFAMDSKSRPRGRSRK